MSIDQWVEPSIDDLVWMIDNIPGYRDRASTHQLMVYEKFKESQKTARWEARQEFHQIDGFVEPFPGYFAGIDLWPDRAPATHYDSIRT